MATVFVVNADDFGLNLEVNAGILRAHDQGIVTSTSVMTNMPYYEAIAGAVARRPQLGVGLHLCLSEGTPVLPASQVASLVGPDGQFHARAELFRRMRTGKVEMTEVAAETRAQAARLRALGVPTDHWNSHQYTHLHPKLQAVIRAVLSPAEFPCMRTHRRVYVRPGGWIRGAGLAAFYSKMPMRAVKDLYFSVQHQRAAAEGYALPHGQLTRLPFRAGYGVLTENAARNASDGVFEWICHPSTARRAEDKDSMDRALELQLLTTPALRDTLAQANVRLATFAGALLQGAHA